MKKTTMTFAVGTLLFAGWLIYSIFEKMTLNHALEQARSDLLIETIVAPAIIDSLNDVTRIPTLQSGIIQQIPVKVGQAIKKGQLLFLLDKKIAQNHAHIQEITLKQAKNELSIQQKQVQHLKIQLARLQSLDKRALSRAELQEKVHEVEMSESKEIQARHQLALATAQLKQAEMIMEQFSVVAPKDGIVLQINAHPNEFVNASQPILFLGDANKIMVRVSIDERDIHQFNPRQTAYLMSNEQNNLKIPLTFVQLDQYIVTQERLNSRVQEVLYSFNREEYPNMVAGQQFDVTISVRKDS